MTENFKETPRSIGEHAAFTKGDCDLWSPRELLVKMLREIDDGSFIPAGILVCYFRPEGDGTRTGMLRSKMTMIEAVGVIEIAKADLLAP